MESIRRILALIRKELLAILKDPRSRFTVLGPPVIQAMIFGYAATYDLNHVRYAVYDQDHSEASRQFLAGLDGSGTFRRVANLRDQRESGRLIDSKSVLIVVQIGQDFERRLLLGQPADVQVIADGRNSNTAGTALNYIGTIADAFNAWWRQTYGGPSPPVQAVEGMVQSEPGDPMVHGPRHDRDAYTGSNDHHNRHVCGARTGTGDIRPTFGNSVPAHRDHDR